MKAVDKSNTEEVINFLHMLLVDKPSNHKSIADQQELLEYQFT